MANRPDTRQAKPARTARKPAPATFDPVPMFDLDAYCTEHPPSIKRIRAMQEVAAAEARDSAIPLDARRLNLRRMQRWLDTLVDQLNHEGDDHDLTAQRPGGTKPAG